MNTQTIQKNTSEQRLLSLDALRGFDMFWLVGAAGICRGLANLADWPWLAAQMRHPEWHGFTFFDLIFPLFLFIAGISFPYSLESSLRKGCAQKAFYARIVKRALLLVFLGMIHSGLLKLDFANQRYPSVLGLIGMSWMFAAFIFMNTRWRGRILWCAGILVFSWLALVFFTAPDYPGAHSFSREGNIGGYIERMILPGKLYGGIYDGGLVCIIPATATALLGMMTGAFVKSRREGLTPPRKAAGMAAAGVALVALGLAWDLVLPINKKLWDSSYVCFTGGLSLLLFALFYWVIDIRGHRRWAFFFTVIGLNSITIYMAVQIIDFKFTANYIFGGIISLFPGNWTMLLAAIGTITVRWLFLYFLYKQKIFLKV